MIRKSRIPGRAKSDSIEEKEPPEKKNQETPETTKAPVTKSLLPRIPRMARRVKNESKSKDETITDDNDVDNVEILEDPQPANEIQSQEPPVDSINGELQVWDSAENEVPVFENKDLKMVGNFVRYLEERFAALVKVVKPWSEKETDQEIVIEATIRLMNEAENRRLSRRIQELTDEITSTYEAIIEQQPEIGEIMVEVVKTIDEKAKLQEEIQHLQSQLDPCEFESPVTTPITKDELREMANRIKQFEVQVNALQSKYQVRYTKEKDSVAELAGSIAAVQGQIAHFEKRIQLMSQRGSNYRRNASSQHNQERNEDEENSRPSTDERPKLQPLKVDRDV